MVYTLAAVSVCCNILYINRLKLLCLKLEHLASGILFEVVCRVVALLML